MITPFVILVAISNVNTSDNHHNLMVVEDDDYYGSASGSGFLPHSKSGKSTKRAKNGSSGKNSKGMGKKGKKGVLIINNNSSNSGNFTKDSSKEDMEKKGALVLTVFLMGTLLIASMLYGYRQFKRENKYKLINKFEYQPDYHTLNS